MYWKYRPAWEREFPFISKVLIFSQNWIILEFQSLSYYILRQYLKAIVLIIWKIAQPVLGHSCPKNINVNFSGCNTNIGLKSDKRIKYLEDISELKEKFLRNGLSISNAQLDGAHR